MQICLFLNTTPANQETTRTFPVFRNTIIWQNKSECCNQRNKQKYRNPYGHYAGLVSGCRPRRTRSGTRRRTTCTSKCHGPQDNEGMRLKAARHPSPSMGGEGGKVLLRVSTGYPSAPSSTDQSQCPHRQSAAGRIPGP